MNIRIKTSNIICYLVLLLRLPLSLGKRKQSVSLDWTVLMLHDDKILQSSVNYLQLKLSIRKPKGENIKFQYSQEKNIQFYSQHEIFFIYPSFHTLHFPTTVYCWRSNIDKYHEQDHNVIVQQEWNISSAVKHDSR